MCAPTLVESVESVETVENTRRVVQTVENTSQYSPQEQFLGDEEIRALLEGANLLERKSRWPQPPLRDLERLLPSPECAHTHFVPL